MRQTHEGHVWDCKLSGHAGEDLVNNLNFS